MPKPIYSDAGRSEPLRIVSYNIHKSVGVDGRRDSQRIIDVIAAIKPDIALLQEVDRRVGRRQTTLMGSMIKSVGLDIVPLAVRPDSHGWHGNAVLVRPDIKVLKAERLELPTLEPRGAVQVDLKLPDGRRLGVIGAHLSLSEFYRRKQIIYIADHMQRLASELPVIFGGDFNHWRSKKLNVPGLNPALKIVTPGRTFPSSKPFLPLDRFLLTPDIQVDAMAVVRFGLAMVASDHLPIYIDVNFKGLP